MTLDQCTYMKKNILLNKNTRDPADKNTNYKKMYEQNNDKNTPTIDIIQQKATNWHIHMYAVTIY